MKSRRRQGKTPAFLSCMLSQPILGISLGLVKSFLVTEMVPLQKNPTTNC